MVTLPKDITKPLADSYDPQQVETGWDAWWQANEFFKADAQKAMNSAEANKFVMVIPPPNVTGSLHIGHALTNSIEDTMTRVHRMMGHQVLWLPGCDHAGIATQSVVEKKLYREEGKTRHDFTREEFVQKIWKWKEESGDRIYYQLRRLGVSVDWSRAAFTMDPFMSKAVTEAFVRMFEKGRIYRAKRLVSWCPHLRTALSEIEVDNEEIDGPSRIRIPGYDKTVEVGVFWHFKYLLKDDPSKFIVVATTRIETMLGDVAVAVHPNDKRYTEFIGKELTHPFLPERRIIVVADEHADPEVGTGAVKITPAHDKNDWEVGLRHNLPVIGIFTLDGRIAANGGQFAGQHRFECRVNIEKALDALGLFVEKVPNPKMQLPKCSRSGDIIELMHMPQWWVDCKSAAKRAADAVRNGDLKLHPAAFNQTWFYWLDNIREWCISRQLWWGHRIPAYCAVDETTSEILTDPKTGDEIWVASRSMESAEVSLKDKVSISHGPAKTFKVRQDEDVLDTWFSSGLFPFATMHWPDDTADLKAFFPNTVLETGHDILFFWVARMVMMSFELMDCLPFKDVVLHAMVRDAHGKKMSKSLGNVIDPIKVMEGVTLEEILAELKANTSIPEKELNRASEAQKKDFPNGIPECGADALRFGLLSYSKQGRNINLDVSRVVGYRHFCNKLWNATKFAFPYFSEAQSNFNWKVNFNSRSVGPHMQWPDLWILHRLNTAADTIHRAFQIHDFEGAVTAAYNFWLYDFCDIYLELLKSRLATLTPLVLRYGKTEDSPTIKSTDSETILTATDDAALQTLFICLETGLRMLHPMMPFVTEELWQRLVAIDSDRIHKYPASISIAAYPVACNSFRNTIYDSQMETVMCLVRQFRSLLANLDVPRKQKLNAFVKIVSNPGAPSGSSIPTPATVPPDSSATNGVLTEQSASDLSTFLSKRMTDVAVLSKLESVTLTTDIPATCVRDVASDRLAIAVDPAGSVNFDAVLKKMAKRLAESEQRLATHEKKIASASYSKVPENVRIQDAERYESMKTERLELERSLEVVTKAKEMAAITAQGV